MPRIRRQRTRVSQAQIDTMLQENDAYSLADAARMLGHSWHTTRNAVLAGKIQYLEDARGSRFIPRAEIVRILQRDVFDMRASVGQFSDMLHRLGAINATEAHALTDYGSPPAAGFNFVRNDASSVVTYYDPNNPNVPPSPGEINRALLERLNARDRAARTLTSRITAYMHRPATPAIEAISRMPPEIIRQGVLEFFEANGAIVTSDDRVADYPTRELYFGGIRPEHETLPLFDGTDHTARVVGVIPRVRLVEAFHRVHRSSANVIASQRERELTLSVAAEGRINVWGNNAVIGYVNPQMVIHVANAIAPVEPGSTRTNAILRAENERLAIERNEAVDARNRARSQRDEQAELVDTLREQLNDESPGDDAFVSLATDDTMVTMDDNGRTFVRARRSVEHPGVSSAHRTIGT